ncbi:hypothetical protein Tco_0923884 [Tanacetum coccineum]|uniref:LAGLIDADG homing endonuclease n=1 Tax=Tanacetum coccineum TaxID=301880 RepID=A0ABQ5D284_9ASTR
MQVRHISSFGTRLRLFKTYDGNSSKLKNFVEKFIACWITLEYYVEGLGPQSILYLLKGSRSTNLYTISIDDMIKSSLVCLLSKASSPNHVRGIVD